jgi:hypothetical protein
MKLLLIIGMVICGHTYLEAAEAVVVEDIETAEIVVVEDIETAEIVVVEDIETAEVIDYSELTVFDAFNGSFLSSQDYRGLSLPRDQEPGITTHCPKGNERFLD